MTVGQFLQTNYTTQTGTSYPLAIDADWAVATRLIDNFAPHAQAASNMTVALDAGHLFNGTTLVEIAAQNTGTIAAPVSNPRIDRVVIDRISGAISVVTGTESASPSPPAIPAGKAPVAQVLLQTSSTAIGNSMLTDERDLGSLGLASGAYTSVGTAAGDIVQLDSSGRLPAVDGSQLINLAVKSTPPVRQCVQASAVDGNGLPNWLSAGTGLAVNLAATATPVEIAFANGFGLTGAQDAIGQLTADVTAAWSSLTASTTCYLYVDRNTSSGALTYGFSTLTPAEATVAPSSPATDQHWFDLVNWQMKRWSGSAWAAVERVFVGEAVTGASSVTGVVNYALQGQYVGPWTNTLPNGTVSANDNLGTKEKIGAFEVECITADSNSGYAVGDRLSTASGSLLNNGGGQFPLPVYLGNNTTATLSNGTGNGIAAVEKASSVVAGLTAADWKYRFRAKRAF